MNPARSALLLGALLALAPPAFAQTTSAAPEAPPAPDDRIRQAAEAYDRGEFDRALDLLQAAYTESQKPALLFNMAQVQRSKNDCATAAATYRRFIDATTAGDPNRDRAERYEGDMLACAARVPAPLAPKPQALTPRPPAEDGANPALQVSRPMPTPDQPERTWSPRKITAYALIGAGVIAAGASAVMAVKAYNNRTSDVPVSGAQYEVRLDDFHRQEKLAWVFGVSSILSAGAGVTLLAF
jgi:hypothetical protein